MSGMHESLPGLEAADFDQMRHELRMLQDKLDRITGITSGIIYILDVSGHFVFINNAVEEILHYTPAEIIGKHFSEIMPAGEYERVARDTVLPLYQGKPTGSEMAPKLFDERRTGSRSTRNLEVQLVTKERRDVKILMGDVTGIIGVEGTYDRSKAGSGVSKAEMFLGSQGIIYDITRYKRIERDKFLLQQRLYDAQKMDVVGRLAGGLAHNFNNKLVAIMGFTELMKLTGNVSADPVLSELLDKVMVASRHTEDLTRRLLSFAHVEDKQEPAAVNIHDIIVPVAELLSVFAGKSIQVTRQFSETPPIIMCERSRMQNAILNVALNSAEAMPFGGHITFSTEHAPLASGGWMVRLVISNAPADSPDTLQSHSVNRSMQHALFEKEICFGLANVEECVKAHGGTLNVSEQSGSSVRVEICLPIVQRQE